MGDHDLPQKWEDNFWGPGYEGFDVISGNMRASKHATQGLLDFIKGRVKLHEEYGRKLQAHVKVESHGQMKVETGSIREAWDALLLDAEQHAQIHINAAQEVSNRIEKPLGEFLRRQREEVKMLEDTIKKSQQLRNNANNRLIKTQQTFESRSKEVSTLHGKLRTANPKEQPKLSAKLKAKTLEADAADQALISAIEVFVNTQKQWADETAVSFRKMQELEAERYDRLQGDVWKMQNVIALALTAQDRSIEQSRISLEAISFVKDQNQFVAANSTGTDLPGYPDVCYTHPGSIASRGPRETRPTSQNNSLLVPSSKPAAEGDTSDDSTPASGTPPQARLGSVSLDPDEYATIPDVGQPQATGEAAEDLTRDTDGGEGDGDEEDVYKTLRASTEILREEDSATGPDYDPGPVVEERKEPAPTPQMAVAQMTVPPLTVEVLFDYPSQGGEELKLRHGEVITVLEKENDTWWKGRNHEGEVGMFPMEFTKIITS